MPDMNENAETQQEYFGIHTDNKETLYNALKRIEELEAQLTKAKEIIRVLLKHTHGQNLNTQNDFDLYLGRIKEAEQFLEATE